MKLPDSLWLSLTLAVSCSGLCAAQSAPAGQAQQPPAPQAMQRELSVIAGKSLVIDSPVNVERVAVADGAVAEALVVTPREVLVNGLRPGQTSFILWQQGGNRLLFDLTVRSNTTRLENIRRELQREFPDQDVNISVEGDTVYVRGTVGDLTMAERAVIIASTLGKPINLLNVKVPPVDPQFLLKVKFADVDRAASTELGVNLFSTGALNTIGGITTGQYPSLRFPSVGGGAVPNLTFTDVLNVFLFRPDLDLLATIKALQSKRLLQILAEPNVLTINGKPGSFLAGGEFPYPTLQGGGAGVGQVTIQFREFGVRISFTPKMTPRGTIRLSVAPEVSALDYANSLTFQGFVIPGLSTRRVTTEIELESGQSFGIGGLLDNRFTETVNKVPGLADIPLIGKLFQSRSMTQNNSELLILVSPEVVRPIPEGQPRPDIQMPKPFLPGTRTDVPRTPGMDVTGPVPVKVPTEALPYERIVESVKELPPAQSQPQSPAELVPVRIVPVQPQAGQPAPAAAPAHATARPPGGG